MDQAEQLRNVIKLHNQNNQNNARVVTITSGKGRSRKVESCGKSCCMSQKSRQAGNYF